MRGSREAFARRGRAGKLARKSGSPGGTAWASRSDGEDGKEGACPLRDVSRPDGGVVRGLPTAAGIVACLWAGRLNRALILGR